MDVQYHIVTHHSVNLRRLQKEHEHNLNTTHIIINTTMLVYCYQHSFSCLTNNTDLKKKKENDTLSLPSNTYTHHTAQWYTHDTYRGDAEARHVTGPRVNGSRRRASERGLFPSADVRTFILDMVSERLCAVYRLTMRAELLLWRQGYRTAWRQSGDTEARYAKA